MQSRLLSLIDLEVLALDVCTNMCKFSLIFFFIMLKVFFYMGSNSTISHLYIILICDPLMCRTFYTEVTDTMLPSLIYIIVRHTIPHYPETKPVFPAFVQCYHHA